MENLDRIEHRLMDLEVKASFNEDMLDQLNQVIVQQQRQIDHLVREVLALRERSSTGGEGGAVRSLRDELPPHY